MIANGQEQQVLSEKLKELESLTSPYVIGYKSALLYYVELNNVLVQICCIFHCSDVNFEHRELYNEPNLLKIGIQKVDPNEVFRLFQEFTVRGEIRINGLLKKFVSPVSELIESRISDRELVTIEGRSWSSRALSFQTSKTIKEMFSFNFNNIFNILHDQKGVWNINQLVTQLNLPNQLGFVPDQHALVYIFAPVFARIRRCGLQGGQAKVAISIAEGLRNADFIHLNILKSNPELLPDSSAVSPKDMALADEVKDTMIGLTYKFSIEQFNRVDFDFKDHKGISRDTGYLDVESIRKRDQYAKSLSRDASKLLVKNIGRWVGYIFATTIGLSFIYFLIRFVHSIWPGTEKFTDPTAIATLGLAAATFFLVLVSTWTAIISSSSLKISRFEHFRRIAEKAINGYLVPLKSSIAVAAKDATLDKTVTISIDQLVLEPHLRTLTFEESRRLPKLFSNFLQAISTYNLEVDADSKKLNKLAENLAKIIDNLISRLNKQYGASVQPPKSSHVG